MALHARIAILVAALLWMPRGNADPLVDPARLIAVGASVVRVEADRERGGVSLGSGVTVAPSIVVTNCHVLREARAITITGAGRPYEVTRQYADGVHDLCFLEAPAWRGTPASIDDREALRPGESVAAIGFTGGTGKSMRVGRVRALHVLDGGRVIESDAAFTSGASGGGLFDANGSLVGVLTFRSREAGGGFYALPVRWIRERLPREAQWTAIGPLQDALPFWQRDPATLPFFMRATPLGAQGRWAELVSLTEVWASSDPRDAEPMRARGTALQALNRPNAAVFAYREALRLAPDDALAWSGLARSYASLGDFSSADHAVDQLSSLDGELAASVRDEVRRRRDGP